ncbi:PAS domain S-box protein [Planctomycetota bacterium]
MRYTSERKKIDGRIENERRNLQTIFDAVPVGMLLVNENMTVKRINCVMARLVDKNISEIVGLHPGNVLGCKHVSDNAKGCGHGPFCSSCPIRNTVKEILDSKQSVRGIEIRVAFLVNGKEINPWLEISGEMLYIEGKKHVILAFSNITERKQAEENVQQLNEALEQQVSDRTKAHKASEERFNLMIQKSVDGIVVVNREGIILHINPAAQSLFGFTEKDLLGQSFGLPIVTGETTEVDVRGASGEPAVAEMRVVETVWDDEIAYLVSIRDITEHKKLEEKLRQIQEELEIRVGQRTAELRKANAENKYLLESIPSVLIGIDERFQVVQWNTSAEEIFGVKKNDIIGRTFCKCNIRWDWKTIIAGIERCRKEKQPVRLDDIRFTRPEGTEGFLGLTLNPIIKGDEESLDVLLLGADITERKIMVEQLHQSQKLESIGQLASGIAHEINTPIQYIGDNTQFLKRSFVKIISLYEKYNQLLDDAERHNFNPELLSTIKEAIETNKIKYLVEEIPEAIQEALDGVDRVTSIVRAMKEFAHPSAKEKTAIDINNIIESTITVCRNEWKYVADMQTDFDPDLELVPCLPGEFNQVILNMIVNAAYAISDLMGDGAQEKGVITIKTGMNGDWAEIRVSDSGSGIPEEIRSKIFDPFFTTKKVGQGTGQGLAIAYDVIVNKHGGTITCETEVGKGTTFIICLPTETSPVKQETEKINV